MSKLGERMMNEFIEGISYMGKGWTRIARHSDETVRIMARQDIGGPGRHNGVIVSATICFRLPVSPIIIFDFLRNEKNRPEVRTNIIFLNY